MGAISHELKRWLVVLGDDYGSSVLGNVKMSAWLATAFILTPTAKRSRQSIFHFSVTAYPFVALSQPNILGYQATHRISAVEKILRRDPGSLHATAAGFARSRPVTLLPPDGAPIVFPT